MLNNHLYEFPGGGELGVWEQKFRLKLNDNFERCIVRGKGGPGIKVEQQAGELLISFDELEAPAGQTVITPGSAMFIVRVEKDGGADGGTATKATWTYTLREAATFGTIINSAAQQMPRPIGAMTYQTGSTGFGVAFTLAGTVMLWNAGEVPTIELCGTTP